MEAATKLNQEHIGILQHTSRATKRVYCGDSPEMQELVRMGFMRSLGKVAWCPDEYFTITESGVWALEDLGI